LLHQDAFAADYQDEYRLLGMAIKFAGTCGKEINIHEKIVKLLIVAIL
jgi:hypothetical protein